MDGKAAFLPVRPLASGPPNISPLKSEGQATPSPKRLPPHLRLRLVRQQEEAAAALAREAQKTKAAACPPSLQSPVNKLPSTESTWNTTKSPLWTSVPPTKTTTVPSSSTSSSRSTTPDGGASIVQHREDGRLTPPVFSPVQEKTVDQRETTKSLTAETTTTVDCQPNTAMQQHPLQPSTNSQLHHNPQVIKCEDAVGKENVHPQKNAGIPSHITLANDPNPADQPASVQTETVGDRVTSSANGPSAVNVWDTDASDKNSPPQSDKNAENPSIITKTKEPQPASTPTSPKNGTGDKQSILTDEGSNQHSGQALLKQVQKTTPTRRDSAKVSDALPALSQERAESIKAPPIASSTPASLAMQQDAVPLKTSAKVTCSPEHKPERKSISSIATNENVNFTGEEIKVVHAIPRPRKYPNLPDNTNVPGHPDPLRAHPVGTADVSDGTPPVSATVATREDIPSEDMLDMTRESLTAIWVHRMRRYRTADVVGGRTEALRDESQVHHDFYGYPLPLSSPTKAGLVKGSKIAGVQSDVGEFVGMAGANAIRDANDRRIAEDDPMKYPPTEPTAPLYRLRMVILCNFAARCREAKHRVEMVPQPKEAQQGTKERALIAGNRRKLVTNTETALSTESAKTANTGLCPLCAPAHTFTMREQHGQLFLESVLLPLSETATYADMVVHVNTSVAERIFADFGMGNARANDPAYPWEDIQAMPVYEDYQGALVLATHRRRVMEDLPMMVDDAGMIKGLK